MKVSLEYLYHFRCDSCHHWWSHADIEPCVGDHLFCPQCGKANRVDSIETFRTEARGHCLDKTPDSQL